MRGRFFQFFTEHRVLFVFIGLVGIVCFFWPIAVDKGIWKPAISDGVYDAVIAFFTGCAFAGVVYTLILQQRDARLTREQIDRQNFESTFFSMLKSLEDTMKNDSFACPWYNFDQNKLGYTIKTGEEAFQLLCNHFSFLHAEKKREYEGKHPDKAFKRASIEFTERHGKKIKRYFNIILLILEHIDTRADNNKNLYTNLLSNTISTNVKILISVMSVAEDSVSRHIAQKIHLNDDRDSLALIPNDIDIEN